MSKFVKKKYSNFFVEITKKSEKWLLQMKVEMELGKVKKFGIGLWIPHRRPFFASPNLHNLFLYFQSPSTMITTTNKMWLKSWKV